MGVNAPCETLRESRGYLVRMDIPSHPAHCPECSGAGEIALFTSVSPCRLCAFRAVYLCWIYEYDQQHGESVMTAGSAVDADHWTEQDALFAQLVAADML